jgi:hypothetical protein
MTGTQARPGWRILGTPGAKSTLSKMSRGVHYAIHKPEFVWWARSVVQTCSARNVMCQARMIRAYVARVIQFTRDPVGAENITPPLEHMDRIKEALANGPGYVLGDCDDAASLSAALGMAVGIPASFRILAFGGPWQHVYTILHVPQGGDVEMDTTRAAQSLPPVATDTLTRRV